MDEDHARARKDHAPESLARLRRLALNLLRASKHQGSTRGKRKRAAWDDAFLLKLVANAQCDCLGSTPIPLAFTGFFDTFPKSG
jgi:hypothetical protein